ncbi:hypothetical protein HYN48_05605 [Flavobacterium magnum]|uniref:Uncharacterized protein n=1 Tax=Flavobacterium magnum TaxID=2162713 RepID=A0A2S0RE78_9FLAO|nr:hypothetical protein [Flavobacterium magnum]AWA29600.1 hypothetical protein HYN48_05605 [Flavobacterium magnum]
MNKLHVFLGIVIGLATALLGSCLFIVGFTEYGISDGIAATKATGQLGKIITIGAVPNIGVFFLLLKSKKDMAWGVIMATMILAIATIFL